MNFGRIITNDCVNAQPPDPPDTRCDDPAFALANPDKCPIAPQLILKPGLVMLCELGSVQLRAVYVENGTETDVTNETVFQSSNPTIAVVGAFTGHATAVGVGIGTISGTYSGLTAFTEVVVLQNDTECCCDDIHVGMMVLVDQTHSMSQAFNSSYPTKLHYARAAAQRWINEVNTEKDTVGLIRFTDASAVTVSELTDDADFVTSLVPGILQTKQKTSFYDALSAAIDILDEDTSLDRKVIVVISDGFDTDFSYTEDADNPISLLESFKSGGGVVVCLGVRAHSQAYSLLSLLATGGFFLNSYDGIEEESLDYLSGLKGYICAGNCTPVGDEYVASGSLDFASFTNWSVTDGHVDLIGNGFMDLLPGNGLYVDMAGSTAIHKGRLLLRESIAIEADNMYRLSVDVAGNQRVNATPNLLEVKIFGINSDGLENPSVAPSFNLISAGGPITPETYRYAYSYVNEFGETELSPSDTITVTQDSDGVDISIPANSNASLIRLWRTTGANPESRYYLIAELDAESPVLIDTMRKAEMEAAILNGDIDAAILPPESNTTGTPITILTQQLAVNDYREDFRTHSFNFTAIGNADVWISVQQLSTPSGHDATGLLLGRVQFENTSTMESLFEDDFDEENFQYVPPRCGIGTTYQSVGEICETTPVETALVPLMTGQDTPSGFADASSEDVLHPAWTGFTSSGGWRADNPEPFPHWIRYRFDSPKIVNRYQFNYLWGGQTADWTFEGSNDGTNWDVLDTQAGLNSAAEDEWPIANTTFYTYYRLHFSNSSNPTFEAWVDDFQMYYDHDETVCVQTYGYQYGYCCYGEGCLDEPPIAQLPDPNPLIDLEAGYTPPRQYTSTRTVCVECDEGSVGGSEVNLVPTMTGKTTPSGVAYSSNGDINPTLDEIDGVFAAFKVFDAEDFSIAGSSGFWTTFGGGQAGYVAYQFASAQLVAEYSVASGGDAQLSPSGWVFEGSNDGSSWTELDERSGLTWFSGETKRFTISSPSSYSYYRLSITGSVNGVGSPRIWELSMFGAGESQQCATATATSEISQADADSQATIAARVLAEADLECQQQWTSTQCFTAKCPATEFGPDVTRCATRTSLVSQAEANASALAAAQQEAQDALDCTLSNNNQRIDIPDRIGDQCARATPYPSVQYVEGAVGVIQKVTVTLNNFAHELYSDVAILLVSPEGTGVLIWQFPMNGATDAVERTFIIDDDAADPLPEINRPAGVGPHTYQPTAYGTPMTEFPTPAPAPNPGPTDYETTLASLVGEDPNGAWSLWVVDCAGSNVGYLANGWELDITLA